MKVLSHILGFPRIGLKRELKKALEDYWTGKNSKKNLLDIGYKIRTENWEIQKKSKMDFVCVGDFAWYDHVLSMSLMLGNVPLRHKNKNNVIDLDTLFRISRGCAPYGESTTASEMTKWFNTNYHYIVPEFIQDQKFKLSWMQLFEEIDEALLLGYKVKPIILGPITYLWLGKSQNKSLNKISLLENILPVYQKILFELEKRNIEWVQIDEPVLGLELSKSWLKSFKKSYDFLETKIKILLTTYFSNISHNIEIIKNLPVNGLHVDFIHGKDDIYHIHKKIPLEWILSIGIINGRNIWKTDLINWFIIIQNFLKQKRETWISSSCSLLHSPIDLTLEKKINSEYLNWFSFAVQKCYELSNLKKALQNNNLVFLNDSNKKINSYKNSSFIKNKFVQEKIKNLSKKDFNRKNNYKIRSKIQKQLLNLPILPTTTIGSFPQTKEIRKIRMNFKRNKISLDEYNKNIEKYIKNTISFQEKLELDILVHGEIERNDMVEYFGENFNGFVFTQNGWVQSYGSRCVKPPIIIGDVSRKKDITKKWSCYAQSLTKKPVKGMLTGPLTILYWSFSREDIPKKTIATQIALAIREEVKSLENSGIKIIQIDEPAFREGLPLKKSEWNEYLNWAVKSFRLSSSIVKDKTQIHTHMCYSNFNDIIEFIAELDADVITIETARSNMKLLESFKTFKYPNEIGPGVYDIHSPNIPDVNQIKNLLLKATLYIPINKIWVNPDCGLKTRNWDEIKIGLKNMVHAAKEIRLMYKN